VIWWTALFLWIQALALVANALVMRRNYKRIKGDSK
jgi:hypothetical protein